MVEKKWIKIAIAGIAALALIIGLSVGISQSQSRNRVASSAYGYEDIDGYECSSKSAKATYSPSYQGSKSGKSDGGGKSGKSSSSPTRKPTATAKGEGRMLVVVPGTEDYRRVNLGLGGKRISTRRGKLHISITVRVAGWMVVILLFISVIAVLSRTILDICIYPFICRVREG